jgi:hypothetical protein
VLLENATAYCLSLPADKEAIGDQASVLKSKQ